MSLLPPSRYTKSLKDMDREELISHLYSLESQQDRTSEPATTAPLECMSSEDIVSSLHHSDKPPPAICPCDTPNTSDTKYHFTAEELHRLMGCRRFRKYRHLVYTTKDGHFLDNGEFPVSIGAYATIPKAPRGKPIDRAFSKYLNIVHVDIAFGGCMSVRGYKYALFLWIVLLISIGALGSNCSITTISCRRFLPFAPRPGISPVSRRDCDEKLFGSHIRSFLHLEHSSIISSPAGCQSSNGLVESHWKIMVHMSRAYLMEKQMPRTVWYYAIKYAARMMNMIPVIGHSI